LGIVLALTISLGLAVTWQVRTVMTHTFLLEVDNRGHSVISDLAGRSVTYLERDDITGLHNLLADTVANHPDARYAFVLSPAGQVLAHTYPEAVPPDLIALVSPVDRDYSSHIHYDSYIGQIHDFSEPIMGAQLGSVRLGLSEVRLQSVISAVTRQMLLTTAAVAVVGVLAAILLTWLLTRPVLDLVDTTEALRQGDLTIRAPHWADDEIGALSDAFNQMIGDLEISQQAIAEKEAARTRLLAQLINAQEEERKRIARELHDGVGQALTSILVGMKLIDQFDNPADLHAKTAELRRTAGETLEDVRLLSRELRPSALDDLGLVAALERFVLEFTQRYPHLTVDLHIKLPERLPSMIETSLYRIVQEAMSNAARHGGADTLSILLTHRESHVQAIIEDNGSGFDVEAVRRAGSSVGLHSMTERAELLGGQVQLESSADGTAVYVEIPL
jgi:signal transduction histidine kinase